MVKLSRMSEHEPHVPDNPPTPGAQPGPDPTAPQPPGETQPTAAPAGPPPGSPQAPPPGSPAPPAPDSPQAPSPGPMQTPAYPPAGYPQQQPGYPQQQPGYPPQGYPQPGYPQQPPVYPPQRQGYLQQAPGPNASHQGYPQPGYPQQAPIAYAPGPHTPRRPSLAPRQKRGAMLAGAVSFALMSLGFGLVAIPIAIAAFGALFGALFGWIATRNPEDFSMDGLTGAGVIERIVTDAWSAFAPWFIGMIIIGVIVWVLGFLSSIWILRGHQVNRPAAVTWSGLGIAIVANSFISGITSPLFNLSSMFTPNTNVPEGLGDPGGLDSLSDFDFTPFILIVAVGGIVGLLVSAVIGLLSWWWMAHAFRARPATEATQTAPTMQGGTPQPTTPNGPPIP